MSKNDLELIKQKKSELESFSLFKNKSRDNYYKKLLGFSMNRYKQYEKKFVEISEKDYIRSQVKNKREFDYLDLLEKSKLSKDSKINPVIHNIESFEDSEKELSKLSSNDIDFNKNFNSIIGNLFLILQTKQRLISNKLDHMLIDYFESNLHKDGDLLDFILEVPIFSKSLNPSDSLLKAQNPNKKIVRNEIKEIINVDFISNFNEVMEYDNYFTLIRNPESMKIVLLITELLTENSKMFKEESLFWIKYSLTLAKIHPSHDFQCRAIILACAFLIDHTSDVNDKIYPFSFFNLNKKIQY